MVSVPTQTYAEWRAAALAAVTLRETRDGVPSERLLQLVWLHQRLRPEALKTLDAAILRVLHPGFWNREAGPDFTGAVLQFGSDPPRAGDVEIDLRTPGWRAHGHAVNPAYRNVILHVVWEASAPAVPAFPTLPLRSCLDAPVEELLAWMDLDLEPPALVLGLCHRPLRQLPEPVVTELLHQAALVRLERKGRELAARARHVGWEQALWEGLCAALGYKHNVWPMRRLAELWPRLADRGLPAEPLLLQARLLGLGGLLPHDPPPKNRPGWIQLRLLWDSWWRERDALTEFALPRSLWRLGGVRPANHPQRRLALAAHWAARGDLPHRLEDWFHGRPSPAEAEDTLRRALGVETDSFWSWHWTLGSPRLPQPQPLLGRPRLTDLAVNVILPWLWTRAEAGGNEALCLEARRRYLAWPAGQDNAVLRRARQRLLGTASPRLFPTAARQQGLLQIVRDFCLHANALCDGCDLPERLASLVGSE